MFVPFLPVKEHVIVSTGNGVLHILSASLHIFNSPENVTSINSKRFVVFKTKLFTSSLSHPLMARRANIFRHKVEQITPLLASFGPFIHPHSLASLHFSIH
jgi:hypothetical protein